MNAVDPQAYLHDVLSKIVARHPMGRIDVPGTGPFRPAQNKTHNQDKTHNRGIWAERGSPMTRIVLAALALLICATFGSEVFAQAGQTINPVPLTPPSINTTATTCRINCDTQAMTCQNTCVPTAAAPTTTTTLAAPLAAPSSAGACNLSCTTQQLVCKQRCGP